MKIILKTFYMAPAWRLKSGAKCSRRKLTLPTMVGQRRNFFNFEGFKVPFSDPFRVSFEIIHVTITEIMSIYVNVKCFMLNFYIISCHSYSSIWSSIFLVNILVKIYYLTTPSLPEVLCTFFKITSLYFG